MLRDVQYSTAGIGLVPDGFYETARQALDLLPDEWEQVTVHPDFERDEANWPTAYRGARWVFHRDGEVSEFLTEMPDALMDAEIRAAYLKRVRYALMKTAKEY